MVLNLTPFLSFCVLAYVSHVHSVISNMRWDSLAQILSHGNVYAGARVLVFESVVGLVVGSAAYRMRGMPLCTFHKLARRPHQLIDNRDTTGHGRIVALYGGQQPHLELVERLNLDDASTNIIEVVMCTYI